MAQFRGIIRGARGEVTRLGHKTYGLQTIAQSWAGEIVVDLEAREAGDFFTVSVREHNGTGAGRELASGYVKDARSVGPVARA